MQTHLRGKMELTGRMVKVMSPVLIFHHVYPLQVHINFSGRSRKYQETPSEIPYRFLD